MLKIETLTKDHNRSEFDCGVDELNQYLKRIARQHINKGISRTFILVDDNKSAKILESSDFLWMQKTKKPKAIMSNLDSSLFRTSP